MATVDPFIVDYLRPSERKELEWLLGQLPVWQADTRNVPQCQAFEHEVFELLYGGAAGGGKSDLILGLARTKHHNSLLLRREFPDLERSLIVRSLEFYGGREFYNASKHVWNIDGKRIEFGHMEHTGTAQQPGDEQQYASAPYDFIAFDQLEQFTQYAYEFMFSRARSTNPEQRVRMVSTCNFIGENVEWILHRWAAWLDKSHKNPACPGELRWYKRDKNGKDVETTADDPDALSRTFIPAALKDNPFLGEDYRRQLANLPEPLRSALLDGNIEASLQDDAYQVIPRAWVKAAMERWTPEPPTHKDEQGQEQLDPLVIGGDVARGGDDQTVFSPRRNRWFAPLEKHDGRTTPDGGSVAGLLALMLASGGTAYLDVIGIGASAYDISIERKLNVYPVNFSESSIATDKSGMLHFINKRAEFWWAMRDALDPKNELKIALPPDQQVLGDLCAPRWKIQSNGIKIEDKEEIKKRIGRSPDCGDAIVISWSGTTILNPRDMIAFV